MGHAQNGLYSPHEQGHFDITELFARKLAKELREYKFDPRKYQDDSTRSIKS